MALGTIRGNPAFNKLTPVVISMTISTAIVLQGISELCFMAFFAVYDKMLVFKLKISFVMIEVFQPADNLKRLLAMALTAVLPVFILMRIFMTTGTVGVGNSAELLKFFSVCYYYFVTLYTLDFLMLPGKLEPGICMTEF
jgi:hypothetical protein